MTDHNAVVVARLAAIVGESLGDRFQRDPRRLADVLGLRIVRGPLQPTEAVFYPPSATYPTGAVGVPRLADRMLVQRALAAACGLLVFGAARWPVYVLRGGEPAAQDERVAAAVRAFTTAFVEGWRVWERGREAG